jgi:hypothetical protein
MHKEGMQLAGKKLIQILALLVMGLVKELTSLNDNSKCIMDDNSKKCKELSKAIKIFLQDSAGFHQRPSQCGQRFNSIDDVGRRQI